MNGDVIPYNQMTAGQAESYRDYLDGEDGLGSGIQQVINHSDEALNQAEEERKEALGER